jgi:hypothetical protein
MAVELSFCGMPRRTIGALKGTGVVLTVMADKGSERHSWGRCGAAILIVTGRQKVLPALRPCALNAGRHTRGMDC